MYSLLKCARSNGPGDSRTGVPPEKRPTGAEHLGRAVVEAIIYAVGGPPILVKGCGHMSPSSLAATASSGAGRTRQLVEAPITPTLLRLAMPNVVVMMAQAAVSTCEMYFIGWLGAEALAGAALVFPLLMLMQTMSAGGMGGGVASAVARALGAGRRSDANALALHALVIAGV